MLVITLIAGYLGTVVLRAILELLNLRERRLHADAAPPELSDCIDSATVGRSVVYSNDKTRLGLIQLAFRSLVTPVFLFGGGLRFVDEWLTGSLGYSIGQAVCLLVGLHVASAVLELPFDYVETFRIEERHGFNRMTRTGFYSDWVKSLLLGSILYAGMTAGGLWLMRLSPNLYWFWVWCGGILLAALLMLIAPTVIEPLFIKTSPLSNRDLADQVRRLAERVGVRVEKVLEVDASRRTAHSNAYFTGIGRVKRVVLFDNLLKQLDESEMLAVLGHELGHWKLKHVAQRLLTSAAVALGICYCFAQLLGHAQLGEWFGIPQASVAAKILLLSFAGSLLGFLFTPISAAWSRRHEWQADDFAVQLTGMPRALAAALAKLARDNLSNLHPHPLYVAFYYSHPPMSERIRKLNETAERLAASA